MAYAAEAIVRGLEMRGMYSPDAGPSGNYYAGGSVTLYDAVWAMAELADRLVTLGGFAEGELRGEPPSGEEAYYIIQGCLGLQECTMVRSSGRGGEMDPAPVVAVVAGAGDVVLEAGTGYIDRIYVIVPIEGEMQVAQGGVYSYYEFPQPRDDRLTDEAWRERLAGPDAPSLPAWAANFVLPGGEPTDWLAFHVGDELFLTEEGAGLNVRAEPSMSAEVVAQLQDAWLSVEEGPVEADGYTWWRVGAFPFTGPVSVEGWIVENQDWYGRWP
jgi:hypothetical protein